MSDPRRDIGKEEVIGKAYDTGWRTELPITLITWPDGGMDLHMQTGTDWKKRIKVADGLLKARGLRLRSFSPEFIGPSGAYMKVEREVRQEGTS